MDLRIIAAVGKNRELGKNNDLIWQLPEDLKFFSRQTKGQAMVMGRKTFESLPGLLPGRHHIVISRTQPDLPEGVELYDSVQSFLEAYKEIDRPVYCIGGAQIYTQMLPYADTLYLTEIDHSFDADVFFPSFEASLYTKEILGSNQENGLCYQWVCYKKR